jgi:hypothetical protein
MCIYRMDFEELGYEHDRRMELSQVRVSDMCTRIYEVTAN